MVETKVVSGRPTEKSGDRMLACRYELKYVIDEAQVAAVEHHIQPFLVMDRFSKLQPGGFYPIVSLYLDSPDLRLCRETLTGQKNRFKLRIRSYTDDPEYPRFFEIKRRVNQVIVKSRAQVRDEDVAMLAQGRLLRSGSYTTDEAALHQFQLYTAAINAGPMVLIRYLRKAYESPLDNEVRVTFDREICYKVTTQPEVRLGGPGWQHNLVTEEHNILEIKFTGKYPAWLGRMAAHLDLQIMSVSKFATSIQQSCALGFCAPMAGSLIDG